MDRAELSAGAPGITPAMIEDGLRIYQEWQASDDYAVENLLRQLFRLPLKEMGKTEPMETKLVKAFKRAEIVVLDNVMTVSFEDPLDAHGLFNRLRAALNHE